MCGTCAACSLHAIMCVDKKVHAIVFVLTAYGLRDHLRNAIRALCEHTEPQRDSLTLTFCACASLFKRTHNIDSVISFRLYFSCAPLPFLHVLLLFGLFCLHMQSLLMWPLFPLGSFLNHKANCVLRCCVGTASLNEKFFACCGCVLTLAVVLSSLITIIKSYLEYEIFINMK